MAFHFLSILFLSLGLLTGRGQAMWPQTWINGYTCSQASLLNFGCEPMDMACFCSNQNYLASVELCIEYSYDNSSALHQVEAWDYFLYKTCTIKGIETETHLLQSTIAYLRSSKKITKMASITNQTALITTPVDIGGKYYKLSRESIVTQMKMYDVSSIEGASLVGWWVLVALICGGNRLWHFIKFRFSPPRYSMARSSGFSRMIQKHLSLPATFGSSHIQKVKLFGFINLSIPTRFESLVVFIYFALNVIFMAAPYSYRPEDAILGSRYKQMLNYISIRSGVMGTIQIPLLVLFALRNNIMIWVTGWSFSTFNTYHRAVSRITYALLVIHAVSKQFHAHTYHVALTKYFYPLPYYSVGVAALVLMGIMIFSGFFRAKNYEVFLILHITASVGSFICAIFHLNGLGYKQPYYVAFGLWAGDWIIRAGRIIFNNVSIFLPPVEGSSKLTKASVSLATNDVVIMKIRTPIAWQTKPGQYVFIHIARLNIWESHPFSVVGPSKDDESLQLIFKGRSGMTKKIRKYLEQNGEGQFKTATMNVAVEGPYGVHCPVERYDSILLVAGGIGITAVLPYAEYLSKLDKNKVVKFVWTIQYETDLSWIGDRLQDLVAEGNVEVRIYVTRQAKNKESAIDEKENGRVQVDPSGSFENGDNDCNFGAFNADMRTLDALHQSHHPVQRLRESIIFSGHRHNHNKNIKGYEISEIDDGQSSGDDVSPSWVFSGPAGKETSYFEIEKSGMESEITTAKPALRTDYINLGQRPVLTETVKEMFLNSGGSTCVLGCGPPQMMDYLRKAIATDLDHAQTGKVDYFEEAFSW